jgi:fibronectin-binding autotransporter adhesin
MKPKFHKLLIASTVLFAAMHVQADTLYWDGVTGDIAGNGDSAASGLTGNWDTALLNWDAGSVPHVGWNNLNNDIAFFHRGTAIPGPNPGTVALTSDITVGGLIFNASGYTISTGANTLTFGGTDNTVALNNRVTATTITGTIGTSAANLTFTAQNPLSNHTLTLNNTGNGWSGSTTVNAGTTLLVGQTSTALSNTSAININGGTIRLDRANDAVAGTQVSDTAGITFNGGGTLLIRHNTAMSGKIENIGAVTVASGQANFDLNNGTSSGPNSVVLASLTRSVNTAAVTFANGGYGANQNNMLFKVTGAANTAAGEIIGSWATYGVSAANQDDYAIYTSGDGTVAGAGIAASAQSGWSTDYTTGTGTLNNSMGAAGAPGETLSASRNINSLRHAEAGSAAANSTTEYFTLAGNTFSNGDIVGASGTNGLTAGTQYYVINKDGAGAGTFQLSTTLGGPTAVNLTNTTAGQIAGAFSLSGFNLGTTGILNGTAAPLIINGSGGVVTLPTTTSGELFVTAGAGAIAIDAPITDNGAGVLTLVKGGNQALTLSGANTYTGGTVANAGTVTLSGTNTFATGSAGADVINGGNITYSTIASWGGTGRDVTFNGTGTLTSSGGYSGGTLSVNAGANANIVTSGSGSLSFATTTGAGNVIYSASGNRLLDLGDASGLTGNLQARLAANANLGTSTTIQFSSIGDAVGSALQFVGGTGDGNQAITVAYNGTSALTFNNRQIEIQDRLTGNWELRYNTIANNSTDAAHTWTINTDLLYTGGSAITAFGGSLQANRSLRLSGSNTGDNAFNGVISNGQNTNGLFVEKDGSGKWILGGANTYTGNTIVTAGNLEVSGTLGNISAGVGDYAGNISISNSSSGTLKFNSTTDQELSGVISGNGAFVKDNTGVLTITNAGNTHTGATNVDGGTLLINGTTSTSIVTVGTGGTLGGSGTVGGVTTVNGALKPGNSPGLLTFSNSLTLVSTATATMEIDGTIRGAGGHDAVDVGTSLAYGGALILDLGTIFGAGAYTFNLFDFAGESGSFDTVSLAGLYGGSLTDDTFGVWGLSSGGNTWSFDQGDGVLSLNVIPEPSAAALLGVLGAMMLLRRRR